MLGSASSIRVAGSGTGATFIEFDNNTELFLIGNNFDIGNYLAVTSITPTAALGSGNGIVNFGIVSDNTQNITFNLGTPDLKWNTISSMGVTDTRLNETVMLGFAMSYIDISMKYKDSNFEDRTKGKGYLFSLYGL